MNAIQAQALLDNINSIKLSNRVKALFIDYLNGIINKDTQDAASVIGRLPASQQLNINETVGGMSAFNTALIARAGKNMASIPDSAFDNPDNEADANDQ